MFRDKQDVRQRHSKAQRDLSKLTAMLPAPALLQESRFRPYVQRIEDASSLDKTRFNSHYLALMQSFAEYVEMLPDSTHQYYAQRGGYFEYALHRSEITLELFRPHLLLGDENKGSEEQCCWQFALFSAALLQGVGKLCVDYRVTLYDARGRPLKEWNPVLEKLIFPGGHYTFKLTHEGKHDFRRRLNLLLAERIMPTEAFNWLANHPVVFENWLALLEEDGQGMRILEAILTQAETLILTESIEELLEKIKLAKNKSFSTFERSELDASVQAGVLFLQWLKQQLASGELCLNTPPLTITREGLTMGDEIFKRFVRDNIHYKSWQAVQKGFLSLGFHDSSVNTADVLFSKFGIVLPSKMKFLDSNTGQKRWVSDLQALYFVAKGAHLSSSESFEAAVSTPMLSEKGVWQERQNVVFLAKSGPSHRG